MSDKTPTVDKKLIFGKKERAKDWNKKLKYYGAIAALVFVALVFLWYAEGERAVEVNWAASYERRCEVCQTMIASGVYTRSM